MKTLNPITTRNHDKAVANAHIKTKASVIDQLQSFIDVAVTHPEKWRKDSLEDFIKYQQATTPIQIVNATENYLSDAWRTQSPDHFMPGTDPETKAAIATFKTDEGEYKSPGKGVPGILNSIKTYWGNGFSSQPTANKINVFSKGLQQTIMNTRNEVLYDDKKRKSFIKSLETMDKTSPFYLAQKFILNPNSLEGIHRQPIEQPKAIFTPFYQTEPQPEPIPEPEQTPHPVPVPETVPDTETPPSTEEHTETPARPRKKVVPATETICIVQYSPKAIAVFGSTKQFKDEFLKLWGRWVPLTDPATGTKKTGWVFSRKREAQVREILKAA
jgi:hypothetical protein